MRRLSEYGRVRSKEFNELVAHAKSELALTFHRYLAGEHGLRKLKISLNGGELSPIDPFLRDHPATQIKPIEHLELDGKPFSVQAFILPHFSKITSHEHEKLGGEEGFVRNQGFYIYRQHRLIMHGTWFRLVRHGELSQLVRIAVNIPNSLDAIWKITVDKSEAQLPSGLRSRLREIVKALKGQSGKVFQSRGGRVKPADGRTTVWAKYVRNGEVRYYLLLIDDEADNASINTAKDPKLTTAINGIIRQILARFPRSAYVGYTATPFANIFIDPDSPEEMENDDLFPSNFIKALDPPSNYVGSHRVFREGGDLRKTMVRTVDDYHALLPLKHKSGDPVVDLPETLKDAVRVFCLTRAIRVLQDRGNAHCSMMINVSRFNAIQAQVLARTTRHRHWRPRTFPRADT